MWNFGLGKGGDVVWSNSSRKRVLALMVSPDSPRPVRGLISCVLDLRVCVTYREEPVFWLCLTCLGFQSRLVGIHVMMTFVGRPVGSIASP